VLELLGVGVGPASLVWPFGHHALSARGRRVFVVVVVGELVPVAVEVFDV
jgi:hypothetical protein